MRSMKTRGTKPKSTAPPADLLVCFPARAHLTLLPKPVCSPARAPSEPNRRHQKKPATAARSSQPPAQQASPLLWAKEMASEPTSPKVTCAGQIKIRPQTNRGSTKNWESVMEEIEQIRNKKKLPNWGNRNRNRNRNENGNPLGFKGEIVNFLSCLRGFRFDFRCFRGFPQSDITSEEEEEEEEDDASKTMFSKWFMVLQEEEEEEEEEDEDESTPKNDIGSSVPPPNALLLMRCRSAPSIGWIQRKPKKEDDDEEEEENEEEKQSKISLKLLMEEEKEVISKKENLVVMDYDADFYKLSSDIAKETWVVSGSSRCNADPLLRSRSWKK